jgi:methylase of polypeptide subunit release factors
MALFVDRIRDFSSNFGSAAPPQFNAELMNRMATALNWDKGNAAIEPIKLDNGNIEIARGYIGPQPAAIFAASENQSLSEVINEAALFAYHASIPWGIVATPDGATIFNSLWIRSENWFRLPTVPWNELESNLITLKAITPQGIADNEIERVATKLYQPDRVLLPVDDALVERLDHWRSETLRHSRKVANVDESLQTLFAQFFILRSVEDRELISGGLPTLRSLCNASGVVDILKLRELIQQAAILIGAEIFTTAPLDDIPELVLGGIINDLYIPNALPSGTSRYNFAWIDSDVLGSAYEKYLSTILAPAPLPPQISLFEKPVRGVSRISVRKSAGVYYTPNYLVRYLTEQCLDRCEKIIEAGGIPRIADFACGSGSFLVAASDSLLKRLRKHDPSRNWVQELILNRCIVGVDIDPRAVTMSRLSLWLRFAEEPDPLPFPSLEQAIIQGDALGTEVWSQIPSKYDVVLGNPPFLATSLAPNKEELAKNFTTARGRFDYSYLFIELALNKLSEGGSVALVVPNRLFRNRDASMIRDLITQKANLVTLTDFGSLEVFEDTSAYIATIEAEIKISGLQSDVTKVRVINVHDLSSDYFTIQLIEASKPGRELSNRILTAYDASHPRGSKPWILISPSARRIRTRLEDLGERLDSIAGIYQGIRTGANDVYIVEIDSGQEGPLARVTNGFGESGIVETALLHPLLFGSDLQRYHSPKAVKHIIYPYWSNSVIPEGELESRFPRTFEYFLQYSDILNSRASLEGGGLRWYELIRKRDMKWLTSPKLLTRDLVVNSSFAIDVAGNNFLIGGTAVVPADPDLLLPLLAYLNSSIVDQFLKDVAPSFRGGFRKIEPQHLQLIPVLRQLLEPSELSDGLASAALRMLETQNSQDESPGQVITEEINTLLEHYLGNIEV